MDANLMLDHVAISVRDLQQSFDWYSKFFGFNIFHQWQHTWMIKKDNVRVGLFHRPNASVIADLDNSIAIQHFAFLVTKDYLEAFKNTLTGLSIPFEGPEDSGVAVSLFVNDPDGHQVELTYYY